MHMPDANSILVFYAIAVLSRQVSISFAICPHNIGETYYICILQSTSSPLALLLTTSNTGLINTIDETCK